MNQMKNNIRIPVGLQPDNSQAGMSGGNKNTVIRKVLLLIWITVLMAPVSLFSQITGNVSKVGTVAAAFLEIEVGSRAVGMGGAYVAVVDDATAVFWNPAGLARIPNSEVVLVHNNWLVDTSFDFVAVAIPVGNSATFAASITSLSTGDMAVRTVLLPEGTGERFSTNDLSAALSYAVNLTDKFAIGVNAKYISQSVWRMSARGFALDIGTLFKTNFNDIPIGMSISNFGTSMRLQRNDTFVNYDEAPNQGGSNDRIPAFKQTESYAWPLLLQIGLAMDHISNENNVVTVAINAAHPNENTEYVNMGVEYAIGDVLALRMGYKNSFLKDSEEGITAGVGTKLVLNGGIAFTIDYAYQDFGRLSNAQMFSIALEF